MPSYIVSISPQTLDAGLCEKDEVVAVFADDMASALRKAERTLRGPRLAALRALGATGFFGELDRRLFKRRAADCH